MKTTTENAAISFRVQMATLKALTGMTNQDLAKLLGCTVQTVSKMYANPFTVGAQYILMVQEYLRKEERKRYE